MKHPIPGMKHPIPVRIAEDLQVQLRQEAKTEGISLSDVIRRIIIRHCAAKKKKAA